VNVKSGPQISGFALPSSVGPEELYSSKLSVITSIAPTERAPTASAGVSTLPALTNTEGSTKLFPAFKWKNGLTTALVNCAITIQEAPKEFVQKE